MAICSNHPYLRSIKIQMKSVSDPIWVRQLCFCPSFVLNLTLILNRLLSGIFLKWRETGNKDNWALWSVAVIHDFFLPRFKSHTKQYHFSDVTLCHSYCKLVLRCETDTFLSCFSFLNSPQIEYRWGLQALQSSIHTFFFLWIVMSAEFSFALSR